MNTLSPLLPLKYHTQDNQDTITWTLSSNGLFNTSSAYKSLFKNDPTSDQIWFWKQNLPPRIKILLWRLLNNALPTKLNLFNKNCLDSPICDLCKQDNEDLDHIFRRCPLLKISGILSTPST